MATIIAEMIEATTINNISISHNIIKVGATRIGDLEKEATIGVVTMIDEIIEEVVGKVVEDIIGDDDSRLDCTMLISFDYILVLLEYK